MIVIDFAIDGKRYPNLADGFASISKRTAVTKKELQVIVRREIKAFLEEIATVMESKHKGPWPSGTSDDTISTRTGRGVRSIRRSIEISGRSLDDLKGEIGGLTYLQVQEKGATIRPKNGQYLTIPLTAALNARGVPKKPRARDWANTFVNRSKSGKLLIWRRVGRRVIPLYLLVGKGETQTEVKIKPRLGMERTARDRMSKFVDNVAKSILKEGFGAHV